MAVYKACLTLLADSTALFGHGSFKRAVRSLDLPDLIQISLDDVLKLEVQLENEVRASAIVIDHKLHILSDCPNHEGLAFFYFDRNDAARNSAMACLWSLVRQLATALHDGYINCTLYPVGITYYCSSRRQEFTYLLSKIDEDNLLGLCANLLTIDSQSLKWRFAHLSVAESFEEHHFSKFQAVCYASACLLVFLVDLHWACFRSKCSRC